MGSYNDRDHENYYNWFEKREKNEHIGNYRDNFL